VPTVHLAAGPHVIRTSAGLQTGVQLDELVFASAPGGKPLSADDGRVTGLGTTPGPAPKLTVVHNGATRMRVHVTGASSPFWLVLGESQSNGWRATVAHQGSLGTSELVDGYANGWLVHPKQSSFDVVIEWTPQRRVWAAIWISLAAALACLGIAVVSYVRRRAPATVALGDDRAALEWPIPARRERGAVVLRGRTRVVLPILAGLAAALIVAPWVGVLVALLLAVMQWRPRVRAVLVLGPPLLLALAGVYILYLQHRFRFPPLFEWPTLFPYARPLGWLAVVLLAADAVAERFAPAPEKRAEGA
jgi:arabinofuranan 3-O-arabinosyltransferase